MLYCKYCNYLKIIESNERQTDKRVYICELAGIIFDCDIELLNIDHPCNSISLLNNEGQINHSKTYYTLSIEGRIILNAKNTRKSIR